MSETNIEGLLAFCSNITKEARKGYYSENDDYNNGYVNAVEDILSYIEDTVNVR
jgi:hypothetical protein